MRSISWNIVLASALLLPAAAVGQAENAATVRRMPWSAPDLQGIWLYPTSTPLERDAAFADKGTSAASWDGPSPSSHHHGTNACKSSRPPVTSPCHDEFGESPSFPSPSGSLSRQRSDNGLESPVAVGRVTPS